MAKKKKAAEAGGTTVTLERAARLHRLLRLLAKAPQTREALTRRLRLGIRGYYRDLEILRAVGINVRASGGKYRLTEEPMDASTGCRFPDPNLSLGEARQLAKGRCAAHGKIRGILEKIEK